MNTANLQLEGMLLALYALLDAIKRKGLLDEQEIEEALRQAEMTAVAEVGDRAEISKSNGEAICFPIRFLRKANEMAAGLEDFATITQLVAETKQPATSAPGSGSTASPRPGDF
jgi:hypothetical protein